MMVSKLRRMWIANTNIFSFQYKKRKFHIECMAKMYSKCTKNGYHFTAVTYSLLVHPVLLKDKHRFIAFHLNNKTVKFISLTWPKKSNYISILTVESSFICFKKKNFNESNSLWNCLTAHWKEIIFFVSLLLPETKTVEFFFYINLQQKKYGKFFVLKFTLSSWLRTVPNK